MVQEMLFKENVYTHKVDPRQTKADYNSSPRSFGSGELKSEYDQKIPQSQTADQPTAPLGWATEHYITRHQGDKKRHEVLHKLSDQTLNPHKQLEQQQTMN